MMEKEGVVENGEEGGVDIFDALECMVGFNLRFTMDEKNSDSDRLIASANVIKGVEVMLNSMVRDTCDCGNCGGGQGEESETVN